MGGLPWLMIQEIDRSVRFDYTTITGNYFTWIRKMSDDYRGLAVFVAVVEAAVSAPPVGV